MRNSVCTGCGTSFIHAVDEHTVCPGCDNKRLRAALQDIANLTMEPHTREFALKILDGMPRCLVKEAT